LIIEDMELQLAAVDAAGSVDLIDCDLGTFCELCTLLGLASRYGRDDANSNLRRARLLSECWKIGKGKAKGQRDREGTALKQASLRSYTTVSIHDRTPPDGISLALIAKPS
jgi:hypothetical protein